MPSQPWNFEQNRDWTEKDELIHNARNMDKWLAEFGKITLNKTTRSALREAAKELVAPEAQRQAPHDTGALENSLKIRALKKSRTRIGGYGVQMGSGSDQGSLWEQETGKVPPYYASWVEFGTEKMAAQPFLRPALWGQAKEILALYRKILAKKLQDQRGAVDRGGTPK